jgi:stearoyl-CoA 9-desaturase NADPH oxidoreductase
VATPDWRRRCEQRTHTADADDHAARSARRDAGSTAARRAERFTITRTDKGGQGGTVTFAISDKSIELDGATTLMEAGEKLGIQMPVGCRMGICQSCVLPLESGYVRDLRSGTEHGAGDRIQTCISAASGDCTINI